MQGIFRKENTDKALKYGIYRHLPTYEKIIRNLVSFFSKKNNFYIENLTGLLYYVQRLLSKRREGGFYETLDEST